MFFTFEEVVRLSEYVSRMPRHVSEELRGWRWSEPPLLHSSTVYLSFSEATYGVCPTGRDVYLRRVARVRPPRLPPGWATWCTRCSPGRPQRPVCWRWPGCRAGRTSSTL